MSSSEELPSSEDGEELDPDAVIRQIGREFFQPAGDLVHASSSVGESLLGVQSGTALFQPDARFVETVSDLPEIFSVDGLLSVKEQVDHASSSAQGFKRTKLFSMPRAETEGGTSFEVEDLEADDCPDEDVEGSGGEELTDDLVHKVFGYLDDTTLCRAAMVCRQWRTASCHVDFWKVLNFENRKVNSLQVRDLCRRYPNAVELNIRSKLIDDYIAVNALRSLRNLQTLILGDNYYGDALFTAIGDCRSLKKLIISDALLGNGGAQEIQLRHESLTTLHIVKCRVLRIFVRCDNLKELSLTRTGAAAVMLVCSALQTLDVSACHKLSDAGVRAAATSCSQLSRLDISNCSYVSDETLREIASTCRDLRSLDASFCPNISLEGVRMTNLTSMSLCHCEGIVTASMTAISYCQMLEELYLDFCWLLVHVTLELPRLRSISLTNCRRFTELTLRTPFLVALNVKSCQSLSRIDVASTSLQKLALCQQEGLSTLRLQCPRLLEVDLSECDSLTNAICSVFSGDGGCPQLTSLTLDSCEGLTAINLASHSLLALSLTGCRNVGSIELACPGLQHLLLEGCDRLCTASLCPVGLHSLNLGICPHLSKLTIAADEMTVLDLRGCGALCEAEISCPSLQSLDASYCSQLDDNCLAAISNACPLIQSLVLAACPSVGPSGLGALNKLPVLTSLDLSYTFLTDLWPVFEACPKLEVLKLSACKYLANDALMPLHGGKHLPCLQELDLSYGGLDRNAIEGLLSGCLHLKHVSLSGCANLLNIIWSPDSGGDPTEGGTGDVQMLEPEDYENEPMDVTAYRMLQTLNCVGCPNIKRVVISSSSGCLHLSVLNLSLSRKLKEVRLACPNLISLNLSSCTMLTEMKLECPKLMSLCLQTSGIEESQVEEAVRDCSLLETLDLRNCPKIENSALNRIRGLRPGIKRLYNSL